MLLVPTRVGPSKIHGTGLFLLKPVPCGRPVWCFQSGFDQAFAPAEFAALPPLAREFLSHYAYLQMHDGHRVLNGDHARFMNHSESPNTGAPPPDHAPTSIPETFVTVALVDLPAGVELTCDYRTFDGDFAQKIGP